MITSKRGEAATLLLVALVIIAMAIYGSGQLEKMTGGAVSEDDQVFSIEPPAELNGSEEPEAEPLPGLFSEENALDQLDRLTHRFRAGKLEFESVSEVDIGGEKKYDVSIDVASSHDLRTGSVRIEGVDYDDITDVQSGIVAGTVTIDKQEYQVVTEMFAMNSVPFERAALALPKYDEVDVILHCTDWEFEEFRCYEWELADVEWTQNDQYLIFDVNEFDAYAGGKEAEQEYGAEADVSSCQVINAAGDYVLTGDLTGTDSSGLGYGDLSNACLFINSSDVTLDCDVYGITNDGTSSAAAILVDAFGDTNNVTITNCYDISGYTFGMFIYGVFNSNVENCLIYNVSTGIYVSYGSENISIHDCFINTSEQSMATGIYVRETDNATVENCTLIGGEGDWTNEDNLGNI
ncbi:MAG: right-handed parallel beta-helix repeat-containing protein, partial [Nanoarchaeota archaeon]|nr:right-handed parallel beta-helix repeat-containing protein [Nanoarchaeota archaeon]